MSGLESKMFNWKNKKQEEKTIIGANKSNFKVENVNGKAHIVQIGVKENPDYQNLIRLHNELKNNLLNEQKNIKDHTMGR